MHGVIRAGVMGLKLLISKSLTVKMFAYGGIREGVNRGSRVVGILFQTKFSFLQSFEALYMVDVYIKRA